MKNLVVLTLITLLPSLTMSFAGVEAKASRLNSQRTLSTARVRVTPLYLTNKDANDFYKNTPNSSMIPDIDEKHLLVPAAVLLTCLPAEAAAVPVVPSALWAYGHYLSILVITSCLVAERNLVKPDMSVEDENIIVKIDVVYGVMAALLIISGFARAAKVRSIKQLVRVRVQWPIHTTHHPYHVQFGQGGDFYIHEILFWVKMTLSGIWGGLSIFPSRT